jgi:exopolysaccharide biosynthesis predicted pyruvyltransferase EpsI
MYEVVPVPTEYRNFDTLRTIRNTLRPDDKLFIHSGYLLFDPHPALPFILDVVRIFFDIPITILPQTVNIKQDWMQQIIGREFDLHKSLTLMCRDNVSFENAKKLFNNVHLKLVPDVVTSLIGNKDFQERNAKKEGIMFCLRNDLERHYSEEEIQVLIHRFSSQRIGRIDTTIKASKWSWERHREKLMKNIISEISTYRVVITDRYHGTILSAIANTPVVVINSADHKLSSGVNWFRENGFNTVLYASNLQEAFVMAMHFLDSREIVCNSTCFNDKYWSVESFES